MGLQTHLFGGEDGLPPPSEALDQWFTRPKVAAAFARFSRIRSGMRVIEPSAGEGALLKSAPKARWTAVEIDRARAQWIEQHGWAEVVHNRDFLRFARDVRGQAFWPLSQSNPPYSGGLDTDFIEAHIENRIASRICSLLVTNFLHTETRSDRIWRWVDLTRIGILETRPQFTEADNKKDGPKRDYSFFEMRPRRVARKHAEPANPEMTWIKIAR